MNDLMKIYTVSLFGHRKICDMRRIDEKLFPLFKELMQSKPYLEILIGRQGEFDEYAASVIKRVQKEAGRDNSSLTLVIPYAVADIAYYEKYYDNIIIPDVVEGVYPKNAIKLKNRWMVEQADLVVVNVEHDRGGAYTAMRYAEKNGKNIINILNL